MAKLVDTLAAQRGALERLAARVPGFGGYLERDQRRQADKLLRDHGAARLEAIGRELQARIAKVPLDEIGELSELVTQAEKLRGELRFADRGYSGFFDEAKLDGDAALDAVYEKDERIVQQVEELAAQVGEGEVSAPALRGSLKRLGLALADRRNAILGLGSR
ncbi:MAG TPA: hypothetical protein VMR50_09930 [Myxococcota bacterium]|nr:hypothetical protein [Myxococcota bacterium]